MSSPRLKSFSPPLRLDHRSAVPLHAQAGQLLRALLRQPAYRDGALLPDEVSLAGTLGISRGTLRTSLAQLVHEGLLERRPGVGTRVRPRAAESGIGAWRGFSGEMARKGIRVENFRQDYALVAAPAPVVRALQIKPGAKLWRLDRVRGWAGRPVLHSRSWFHAREEFAAVPASAPLAAMLAVRRGEPLLLRSHTVFDPGGRPIEFAEVHYVSPRFALTLEIRREEK